MSAELQAAKIEGLQQELNRAVEANCQLMAQLYAMKDAAMTAVLALPVERDRLIHRIRLAHQQDPTAYLRVIATKLAREHVSLSLSAAAKVADELIASCAIEGNKT